MNAFSDAILSGEIQTLICYVMFGIYHKKVPLNIVKESLIAQFLQACNFISQPNANKRINLATTFFKKINRIRQLKFWFFIMKSLVIKIKSVHFVLAFHALKASLKKLIQLLYMSMEVVF